jgi:hypothetical protein
LGGTADLRFRPIALRGLDLAVLASDDFVEDGHAKKAQRVSRTAGCRLSAISYRLVHSRDKLKADG